MGLGLIGGSWAGALHALGWQVWAIERRPQSLRKAIELNWVKEGWNSLPPQLDVDLAVIALPLSQLKSTMAALAVSLTPGTIVTDVGSLKTMICKKSFLLQARGIHFIGGHPMTGSEKSGIDAATPDLFRGYPYVLTPSAACPAEVLQCVRDLIGSFGAKVVLREASRHDREVAMVSHIPHILAVTLVKTVNDRNLEGLAALQLAGRSFHELTRIADSSPEMWRDIIINNAAAILEGLDHWLDHLEEMRGFIKTGNGDAIAEAFQQANLIRREMNCGK
jgi:prephenate dehydrogenase